MTIAIKNATLFDGSGGAAYGPVTVVVEDNVVDRLGPSNQIELGENVDVVDAGGKFLMPGLIDCHIHITGSGDPDMMSGLRDLVPLQALKAAQHAKDTLEAGITAVRDAGASFLVDVAIKQAINSGLIPGPRIQVAGCSLSITGGHGDSRNGWPSHVEFLGRMVVDSPDEARRAAREQLRDGADHIKLHATGGVMSAGDVPTARGLTVEEMRAAIEEANNVGKKSMAHAQGSVGIKNAILAGISSIEHGFYLTDEIIGLMLKNDVFMVPTLSAVHHIVVNGRKAGIPDYAVKKAREAQEAHTASFLKAYKAGVKIAMGTDSATPFNFHGRNAIELELMVNAGMTRIDALLATTRMGAELLGHSDTMGQIKPGYWADMILVDGNPVDDVKVLQDTAKITMVMKDGKIVARR